MPWLKNLELMIVEWKILLTVQGNQASECWFLWSFLFKAHFHIVQLIFFIDNAVQSDFAICSIYIIGLYQSNSGIERRF